MLPARFHQGGEVVVGVALVAETQWRCESPLFCGDVVIDDGGRGVGRLNMDVGSRPPLFHLMTWRDRAAANRRFRLSSCADAIALQPDGPDLLFLERCR